MEKDKKIQTKYFWLRLWEFLDKSHKQIKILCVFILIFETTRLISPYLLKIIIDKLINFSSEDISLIVLLTLLMFLSSQTDSIISYFKDKKIFSILINIEYYLPVKIHQKLVYLSLNYHEKENTGNKITKIERGIQKIIDLLGNMSWEVVPTLTQLTITLAVLFIVDWRFGASFAIFAPSFIWITYKANRDLAPVRKIRHKYYEVASGKMAQAIININTVKSFVQENRETREYDYIRDKIKYNELKEWFGLLKYGLGRNLIVDIGRITILLLGIYLVWNKAVSVGTLVFTIMLSEKAYFSLWRLSRFYDKMEEGKEAVNRLMKVVDIKTGISNPPNGLSPKKVIGKIEFKNVNFSYDNSKIKAMDNVNLKINAGCVTALVGPSGGGKTTVARMIYRHYDPQTGSVYLDGKDLREYDLYNFRKFIAIVPQEVEIFNSSVRDNIAYANPGASFKEVEAAAKIANADEFIDKLARGYKTEVGERGVKLSGGQRQRVGIARAILADPRILIFDEATSSLDSYSEKLIQSSMQKISKGRTMIIIAHRLSTIKKADKIIVLEEGGVVEQGSHYELSKAGGGLYAKLLKLQELGDVD